MINWLAEIANLKEGEAIRLKQDGTLNPKLMSIAIVKQYGVDFKFKIVNHGDIIFLEKKFPHPILKI